MQLVTKEERETIARLRNCIVALVQQRIMLFDTSIQYTYDASLKYKVSTLCDSDMDVISYCKLNVRWIDEKQSYAEKCVWDQAAWESNPRLPDCQSRGLGFDTHAAASLGFFFSLHNLG